MRIIVLSAYYHDSAAALVVDGRVVAAAQEERFTRHKHDASFPHHALAYCLKAAGTTLERIPPAVHAASFVLPRWIRDAVEGGVQ